MNSGSRTNNATQTAQTQAGTQMEIIILPYMAISFSIGWAIFSPFSEIDDLHQWSFAKLETGDLLAVFIPVSFLMAFTIWLTSDTQVSTMGIAMIAAAIGSITFLGLLLGLFLLAKMNHKSAAKRMAIIGVIMPLGALLTIAWFALPMIASTESVLYPIPATISVVPATILLRFLSGWVCDDAPLSKK